MKMAVKKIVDFENYKQANVPLSKIKVSAHFRKNFEKIEELAFSVRTYGLINRVTLSLNPEDDKEKPYLLIAGHRRFEAFKYLQETEKNKTVKKHFSKIPANICKYVLSEREMVNIEFQENSQREDLNYSEQLEIMLKAHRLNKEYSKQDHVKWNLENTGRLFNKSIATISRDIRLAEAIEKEPDLKEFKSKKEAMQEYLRRKNKLFIELMENRAVNSSLTNLVNSYIVNDFFESASKIQERSIDLCEIDCPYPSLTEDREKNSNEITPYDYLNFLNKTLSFCYKAMKENSWLIVWFSSDPWFNKVHDLLKENEFKATKMCGLWIRNNTKVGLAPDKRLANSYEPFFYASKGDPILAKKGRSNLFTFSPVDKNRKIHPTERPLGLMKEILQTFLFPGSKILVPFLGSGVTNYAAHKSKMSSFGYDIMEKYKIFYTEKISNEWK
jgi:DNA modification methylase